MIRMGLDIGGSGMKAALVDAVTGELVTERVRVPTPSDRAPDSMARVAAELVARLGGEGTVGITMPCVVTNGTTRTAANVDKAWIGTDARALYSGATGRPCLVANDADLAGVAEMRHGAGKGHDGVVLLLTLGTGIGSGLFVDGRLVPNTELGHIEVRGKEAETRAAASVREEKGLGWKKWARLLDEYIDTVERLVWPDLIILGGGVAKEAGKFVPLLSARAPIVAAKFLNNAGIVGAAMLAAEADAAAQAAANPPARPRASTRRAGGGAARGAAPSASTTRPAGAAAPRRRAAAATAAESPPPSAEAASPTAARRAKAPAKAPAAPARGAARPATGGDAPPTAARSAKPPAKPSGAAAPKRDAARPATRGAGQKIPGGAGSVGGAAGGGARRRTRPPGA